jgi:hypothetical protein
MTPWTEDQPVARPLPVTQDSTNIINAHTDRHPCLRVGFKPTIALFDRAKTVLALDRAAIVICLFVIIVLNLTTKEYRAY